jgi:hypothetical protein
MVTYFMEIKHYLKFNQGKLLSEHQSKLHIVGSVDMNICIVFKFSNFLWEL